MPIHIGIVAGEASGDLLGAGLIKALQQMHPELTISGIGGPAMMAAGCHSLYSISELAVMGIIEPLKRLPRLIRIRRHLYQHFLKNRPDVFVGIDAPDFNLGLELKLRQQHIPTVHYVSPSVWAWRQYRIHHIARAVDLMLTLLPFEAQFYEKHQVPAKFVGHPLADRIPLFSDQAQARASLGLSASVPVIALLPGSRQQELQHLGRPFLETALLCLQQKPQLQFITTSSDQQRDQQWRELHHHWASALPLQFFIGRSHEVMAAADAILVTSGTATLEAMLLKRPMVIAYATSPLNFLLAKWLVKIPFIGLPNLLAGEALVPEFIQKAVQPSSLSQALLAYLDHPEKNQPLLDKFQQIHQQLLQQADRQAAAAVLALVS